MTALPEAATFDFGGVLYDIDYDAPVRAFKALGVDDFAGLYKQASQSPEFDDLESGRIAPEAFLAICEGHGISPERTLFIDDLKQHVEGATQAGLVAHWHHPVAQDVAVRLAKRGFDIPETAYRNQA